MFYYLMFYHYFRITKYREFARENLGTINIFANKINITCLAGDFLG